MKTALWELVHLFSQPRRINSFQLTEVSLPSPPGVDDAIRASWDAQLGQHQARLAATGIPTEIRPYHADSAVPPLNALYEQNRVRIFPGPCLTYEGVHEQPAGVTVHMGVLSYPFAKGMGDPSVQAVYLQHAVPLPGPLMGFCAFVLTQDDKLALTVRGPLPNLYPNRLYGQGGSLTSVQQTLADHQISEIADEIFVLPTEYDPTQLRYLGIVADHVLGQKPDLIGWVPVPLTAGAIRERVHTVPLAEREIDAVDVEFAPASEGGLFDYLARHMPSERFVPNAQGGLVLFGRQHFGEPWADDLLRKLE